MAVMNSRWASTVSHSSVDALALGGHDRRTIGGRQASWGEVAEVEHLLEVAAGLVGALAVGLVDHEHVGDLHQAGLVGLHARRPSRG